MTKKQLTEIIVSMINDTELNCGGVYSKEKESMQKYGYDIATSTTIQTLVYQLLQLTK